MKQLLKISSILLIVLLLSAIIFYLFLKQDGIKIIITKDQINKALAKKFPVEEKKLLVKVKGFNPVVELKEDSKKIHFAIETHVKLIGIVDVNGNAEVSTQIHYDRKQTAFFLKNLKLEKMDLSKFPDKFEGAIQTIVTKGIAKVLNVYPIYKLNPKDYRQDLAKMLLDSIEVKQDKLYIFMKLASE